MRNVLILTMLVLCVAAVRAQPTPRPGRQPATPVLMPRGGSDLMPANHNRSRNLDSSLQPGMHNRSALAPNALTAPESASRQVSRTEPIADAEVRIEAIEWLSLQEALERSKTEKRKILIDVYTKWCGWCKRMDQSTFTDPRIVEYVNANYYAVKFDAEQEEDIEYKGKTYKFKRTGARGYHELAAEFLNNRLGYPTIVFLDEEFNMIQPIPGFQDGSKMEIILHYFGTDSHKTTPWETYERRFPEQRSGE